MDVSPDVGVEFDDVDDDDVRQISFSLDISSQQTEVEASQKFRTLFSDTSDLNLSSKALRVDLSKFKTPIILLGGSFEAFPDRGRGQSRSGRSQLIAEQRGAPKTIKKFEANKR